MATTTNIVIGAGLTKARKPLVVELVGETYQINPPKTLAYMEFIGAATALPDTATEPVTDAAAKEGTAMVMRWIEMAFGDQADAVKGRLEDNDDSLDIDHINQLINAIQEHLAGGTPPTPPSD